jgi:glycosyltransferase involved in cell wall biosynthesis
MKEDNPLVSAIIPAYNAERYVGEAIQSVLDQDYKSMELIIVDDGSKDKTAQIIKQFGGAVRYFFQENAGLAAALNRGVNVAKGDYFAFLDSDDRWLPYKISQQMAAFGRDPGLDIVFGYVRQFYSPELKLFSKPQREILAGCFLGTTVVKRGSFLRVGQLPTKWELGEFAAWYAKAITLGLKSLTLNSIVTERRIHGANMTIRKRDSLSDYARIMKDFLDEKRKRNAA